MRFVISTVWFLILGIILGVSGINNDKIITDVSGKIGVVCIIDKYEDIEDIYIFENGIQKINKKNLEKFLGHDLERTNNYYCEVDGINILSREYYFEIHETKTIKEAKNIYQKYIDKKDSEFDNPKRFSIKGKFYYYSKYIEDVDFYVIKELDLKNRTFEWNKYNKSEITF